MRKLLVPAAAAALLATSALGFAATQHHTTGIIKAYDMRGQSLTLADGHTYILPKPFKDPGLKVGEKVSINWEMKGSHRTAEHVMIVR